MICPAYITITSSDISPITPMSCEMIITDIAVFQRPDHDSPFKLIETAPGVTRQDVEAKTSASFDVAL